MKANTRNILTATLIAGAVVAGAGLTKKYIADKKEKDDNTKKELRAKDYKQALENLTSSKAFLDSVYVVYNTKHDENIVKSKNFVAQNPDCDNIDSLYALCDKVYNNVQSNRKRAEKAFEAKLAKIGKKFCGKDGKYAFIDEGSVGFRKPSSVYDWLIIINENAEDISNYDALIKEYETLEEIDNLLYSFEGFYQGKIEGYLEKTPEQRGYDIHNARKVVDYDTIRFEKGYYLAQETYKFVDDESQVYKYNTLDNIQQDDFIKVLYRDYLHKFKKYNTNNTVILDEKLYSDIVNFMITIRQHNEIESEVASYNIAIQDVSKRKSDIEQKISGMRKELQQKSR